MPEAPDPTVATPAPRPPRGLRALAVVRGWPAARATLGAWRSRPVGVVAPWIAISLGIACVLLGLVWLVGANSPADPTRINLARLLTVHDAWLHESWTLFRSNLLVLALHAMACLAGFIVHLALTDPVDGEHPRIAAWSRGLAVVAVAFVPIATVLSIATQSWVLGGRLSTLADQLHLSIPTVLWTTTTHSLLELAAVFLPLAASMYLIAIGRPDQLLAATVATVVVALPALAVAAVVETRVWPDRLVQARLANPDLEGQALARAVVDPDDLHSARAELVAGRRRGDSSDTLARAIAEAKDAGGLATVVLEVEDGYVVHFLEAERTPHLCDRLAGMRIVARPISIDELEALRLDPATSEPIDGRVRAFVGDSRVVTPESLDPGDVEPRTVREC